MQTPEAKTKLCARYKKFNTHPISGVVSGEARERIAQLARRDLKQKETKQKNDDPPEAYACPIPVADQVHVVDLTASPAEAPPAPPPSRKKKSPKKRKSKKKQTVVCERPRANRSKSTSIQTSGKAKKQRTSVGVEQAKKRRPNIRTYGFNINLCVSVLPQTRVWDPHFSFFNGLGLNRGAICFQERSQGTFSQKFFLPW